MVFMGADGVEGNKSLLAEAEADIRELMAITGEHLSIFIERHGEGAVQRHQYLAGKTWQKGGVHKSNPTQLANGVALTRFIESSVAASNHKPGDYSLLVLWGHAYRFAISHTDTPFGIDALDFAELATVLKACQESVRNHWIAKGYKVDSDPKLDIVGFDACSLSTLEMAYQLEPFADYLIASQVGVPLPGWPYTAIFDRLATPAGKRAMGPAELGSYAVRRYCEYYRALDRPVTLTHLKLSHAPDLLRQTEGLARALVIAMDDDANELRSASRAFDVSQTAPSEPFVDILSLCAQLVRESCNDRVRAAALALGDRLLSPTGEGPNTSAHGDYKPFIVEHGRNSCESAALHGVSLYAPNVAPGHDFGEASYFYDKFVFARETLWRDLVRALALPTGM